MRAFILSLLTTLLSVGLASADTSLTVNKEIFLLDDTSPTSVGLGVPVRYKINIKNVGDPSSVVSLDDPLPPEFVPIPGGVTCHVIKAGTATCPTTPFPLVLPVTGIGLMLNGELEIWVDGYFKAPPSKPNRAVATPALPGCPSKANDAFFDIPVDKRPPCSNHSEIAITVPLAAVPVDIKVTKTATPKTGTFPATIKWDITVENTSAQDIYLGQILTLKDDLFSDPNQSIDWTVGAVACTSSLADCPELPTINNGTLPFNTGIQLFSTKFEGGATANDLGFMKGVVGTTRGGFFTLSFELTFTANGCTKGNAKVTNEAFVELTSGVATVGDINSGNNTGSDVATLVAPANVPACPPDPGIKKEQLNSITNVWENPSTQTVMWGTNVRYRVTLTNLGTATLTVPVRDQIYKEPGTPAFTATLTTPPSCSSGCTGLAALVTSAPTVVFDFLYNPNLLTLWTAQVTLGSIPAVIEFEVKYDPSFACETDPRTNLIHNRASSGGSVSEVITKMMDLQKCDLKVTKTQTPPGPIVFDQPVKYDVSYSNNSAVSLDLLTRDVMNILSTRYGTVPVEFGRACDVPTGSVTPIPSTITLPPPGSGSSGVQHESQDWIGLKPIDQVLTFGSNSTLHCIFTVTPHRPADSNPFCQGADDPKDPAQYRNYAYLDFQTFNENNSVKPASSAPPSVFHVESSLPLCRKVIVRKNRIGAPPLPDILPGGTFSYVVTVTNKADDAVSNLTISDDVLAAFTGVSASSCSPSSFCIGSPAVTGNKVTVSFNTLPAGQVVTFEIKVTAPTVGGSFPNVAIGTFPPGGNFYFQGDEKSLLHGDEQVQVIANPGGFLEVCKASTTTNPVTGNFTFTATSGAFSSGPLIVPVGACTGPIPVPAGTVTITETPTPGVGVNAITASGFNPATMLTENRLVPTIPPDLAKRTATVTVVPGDVSTVTVATFTNFTVPTGFLEVCKDVPPGITVTGGFSFNVSGAPNNPYVVPAGACTGPIPVQAGSVTVTELPRLGFQLADVSTIPLDRLVSKNIPGGSAIVTVVGGDISTETVVRFNNPPSPGQLKVCKVAGTGIVQGQTFTISANGVSYTVPAGPASQGGFCVLDGTFPAGTVVTVQETVPIADQVVSIAVSPPDRSSGTPNLVNGTAQATIGAGFTEVTFTNAVRTQGPSGQLKICKVAGNSSVAVGTNFTFTASVPGGSTQIYTVPAGPASQGGFCIGDGTFPLGTTVTVTEATPAGTSVTGITVAPAGRGGTPNLANRTVQVTVGTGVTEVAFTNTASAAIATTALLNGPMGAGYSQMLAATGGTPPYFWQLTDGTLPPGFLLNPFTGEISGASVTGLAPVSVTFTVTDSSWPPQTASASFTASGASAVAPKLQIDAASIRDR